MQTITVPVTDQGIVISPSLARQLGCQEGGWAAIDVRPLLSSEELQDRALYYAMHHLGDAVLVDEPEFVDDGWRLPLRVRNYEGAFGAIYLSTDGEVDEARSTSLMELLEALRASGTDHPTTG